MQLGEYIYVLIVRSSDSHLPLISPSGEVGQKARNLIPTSSSIFWANGSWGLTRVASRMISYLLLVCKWDGSSGLYNLTAVESSKPDLSQLKATDFSSYEWHVLKIALGEGEMDSLESLANHLKTTYCETYADLGERNRNALKRTLYSNSWSLK